MSTTRLERLVRAPRAQVYRVLIDPSAVAQWMVPEGMTSRVHDFDAREGGAFHISLTYESPAQQGKSSAHTDTYHGVFVKLVPDREVVQTMEFETDDPSMRGAMTTRFELADAAHGGTLVTAVHENLPAGVNSVDNELGWNMALDKLAKLVEG
jgi:uncharacterized protein YndB with AHSA1/START domain